MTRLPQAHKSRYPLLYTPLGSCSHAHHNKAWNKCKHLKGPDWLGNTNSQEWVERPGRSLSNCCQGDEEGKDVITGRTRPRPSSFPISITDVHLIWDTQGSNFTEFNDHIHLVMESLEIYFSYFSRFSSQSFGLLSDRGVLCMCVYTQAHSLQHLTP